MTWGVPVIVGALQRDRIAQFGGILVGALMTLGVLGYAVTSVSEFPVEMFTGLGQLLRRAQTLSLLSPFLLVVTPLWRRFRHNVVLGPVTVEMAGKLPAASELTRGDLEPSQMDDQQLATEISIRVPPDPRVAVLLSEVLGRWHDEQVGDELAEPPPGEEMFEPPQPPEQPGPWYAQYSLPGPVPPGTSEEMFWSGQAGRRDE